MPAPSHRTLVRFVAAAISGAAAIVYVLIATNVVTVMEDQTAEAPVPPIVAASLLAVVAGLLVRSDRPGVLIGAMSIQAFLIIFYFLVAIEREPAFEAWGIGLKIAQTAVLLLLTWLLVTRPSSDGQRTRDTPVGQPSTVSSETR